MLELIVPDLSYSRIEDIPVVILRNQGIKGLILDIDNTLVPWGSCSISREAIIWLKAWKNLGGKVCLLSNTWYKKRIRMICFDTREYIDDFIIRAFKPLPFSFKKAKCYLKLSDNEIAVIGDQLFTDVLGGNICNFMTIKVDPLSIHEMFVTRVNRKMEKFLAKKIK